TRFSHGHYYTGRSHRHWTHYYWNPRYGCNFYWDPWASSYYYWYAPEERYYPASYVGIAPPPQAVAVTQAVNLQNESTSPAPPTAPPPGAGPLKPFVPAQ